MTNKALGRRLAKLHAEMEKLLLEWEINLAGRIREGGRRISILPEHNGNDDDFMSGDAIVVTSTCKGTRLELDNIEDDLASMDIGRRIDMLERIEEAIEEGEE